MVDNLINLGLSIFSYMYGFRLIKDVKPEYFTGKGHTPPYLVMLMVLFLAISFYINTKAAWKTFHTKESLERTKAAVSIFFRSITFFPMGFFIVFLTSATLFVDKLSLIWIEILSAVFVLSFILAVLWKEYHSAKL